MSRNKFYILFSIAILSLNATAQMTGSTRVEYIDGHTKSCVATQSSASINAGVTNIMIRQYCKCSAVYIADMLNNKLAVEIYEGRIKFNAKWNEMSANYCRINFGKY
jgi:hypothetical protein